MAKRLMLLNGVAIAGVILFHATGFGFTAMFSWAHRYRAVTSPNYDEIGTAPYYVLRIFEQLTAFVIPSFFFVSGFFAAILAGRNRAVDPRAIGARIKNLVIPYLLWSAVGLLALALQGRVYSPFRYAYLLVTGSSNPNYYFVPVLIQLYLVAPLIVALARQRWRTLLVVAAAIQLAVFVAQYVIILHPDTAAARSLAVALPKWLFLVHQFWFTFGVVVGLQHHAIKPILDRARTPLFFCLAASFVLGMVEWELLVKWSGQVWVENRMTAVDAVYAVSLIMLFLTLSDVQLPFSRALLEVGSRSYGIYLVHGFVMEYFSRGLYHLAPWILGQQMLFQPMLMVVGLAVPLVLMSLVNRSPSRGMYSYVFG